MLKVLNVINWILFIILLLVTVGGYFLWDKVIKYKLPDDDDDEIVDNVIYKPVQYTENSPMNAPEQEKFDPRSLYQEDDANNQAMLNNMANNQNPFANYNPQNSTFNNAFNDDNNNLIAINMDHKEGNTSSARTYCINYSSESGIYYVAFYYVNSNNCSNTKQDYQKWQLRKGYTLDTEKNLCSITSTEKYNIVECSIRVFTENTSNNKDNNNTLDDIVFSFKYNN